MTVMANFSTRGLEEVERQLLLRSENAVKAVPLMIDAGVTVIIRAQQAEAAKLTISGRSKGALVRSIKATPLKKDGSRQWRYVYPQGTDRSHTRKGVPNAEKGFVLEYGRTNMPATQWMSTANDHAFDDVIDAEFEVWEKMTNGSG